MFGGGAEGVIVSDEDNPGGFAAETGASTIDEAKELVGIGEWAVYKPHLSETRDGCLIGRPLSSAACAADTAARWFRSRRTTSGSCLPPKAPAGSRAGAALYSLGETATLTSRLR